MEKSHERPYITWLIKTAQSLGIDTVKLDQDLLESIEIHSRDHADRPLFEDYLALLEAFEAQTGDHDIGLHLGERLEWSEIGTYGYVLLYASTVEEFLSLVEHYERLLVSTRAPRLVHTDRTSRFEYHNAHPTRHPAMQDIALNLSAYTKTIRSYAGPGWNPVSAGFTYSQPREISEYKRMFGDQLSFSQPASYIEIQSEVMGSKIRDTDPGLLAVVRSYADGLLEHGALAKDICARVKSVITESMGLEHITQEAVAARLNVSRSSLQRHLKARGSSFQRLREEVVLHLAMEALATTDTQITQIALTLGFAETSSFTRAFVRLSGGMTPSEYRQSQGSTAG